MISDRSPASSRMRVLTSLSASTRAERATARAATAAAVRLTIDVIVPSLSNARASLVWTQVRSAFYHHRHSVPPWHRTVTRGTSHNRFTDRHWERNPFRLKRLHRVQPGGARVCFLLPMDEPMLRPSAPDAIPGTIALGDILTGLSHALDITEGHPRGHTARSCLIGMRLAHIAGVRAGDRTHLFYALLLKDAGCSSNAARVHHLFGGNDQEAKHAVWLRDWRSLLQQAAY